MSKRNPKGSKGPSKKDAEKTKKDDKDREFELPAFGIVAPKKKPVIDWEKLRKDMARRHAPEGEDIKGIRRILKEVKGRPITVHEFINLVSQYTADNGTCLRTVMAEDLEAFRKIARRVYETMTQDVSDVLVNEQLQMLEFYQEKHDHQTGRMMKAVNEIYDMVAEFDFEKYLANKQKYLNTILPLPGEIQQDDADIEMQKRQAAYHRLQWLKSEGQRMSEENRRLQSRLEELKDQQQAEQNKAADVAAEAEAKRQDLIQQEAQMEEKLEELNKSVEKSFVEGEVEITTTHNKVARQKSTGAIKKRSGGSIGGRQRGRKQEWSTAMATEIEDAAIQGAMAAEVNKAPTSKTSIRKARRKAKAPHFSPIKTPPPRQERERSPFHYSPPTSPPAGNQQLSEAAAFARPKPTQGAKPPSPFHYSPPKSPIPCPQPQETRSEETSTTVHQKRPQPRVRPGMAPRDTWGGFY